MISAVCLGDQSVPPNGIDDACEVPEYKWMQKPDLDFTGIDVRAQLPSAPPELPVGPADDFLCTVTGLLTEIHVWGSWLYDNIPGGDPHNSKFTLTINSDIPDPDGPGPLYSMPGDVLWSRMYLPGEFTAEPYAVGLHEGYYDPSSGMYIPFADTICWRYRFPIPEGPERFIQRGSESEPIVYWLGVQAIPQYEAYFGWKTSLQHWNDDAVWTPTPLPNAGGPWFELRYPPLHPLEGQSIDLAFAIFGLDFIPPDWPTTPIGEPGFEKVRHISFVPGNPLIQTALRVTLSDLPPPFEGDEGCKLWVGAPSDVSEVAGSLVLPPTFKRSRLVLEASRHCMDWSTVGTLHVTDNEIVPKGVYNVEAIDCTADPLIEANYSAPLAIPTSKWGDIVGGANNQPPNGVVNFNDISSVVDKFKNLAGAPIKSRADVAPDVPDRIIDFVDIPAVVDAFKGLPYPYGGPDNCPP
jgi:hypothetical protein